MKKIAIAAGVLVVILLLAVLALPFLLDANRFRPELEAELSKVLARDVKVGDLKLAIFSGSVSADDVSISDDPAFGTAAFLKAKSLNIGAELWPLIFSHKLNVTGITIDKPEILLLQSPAGEWNFSSLGTSTGSKKAAAPPASSSSSAPLDLSVKSVSITSGRLTMGRTHTNKKPLVLESVDVDVKDFSATSQFPFSMSAKVAGGGDIKLDGKAGPIHPADASMTPFDLALKVHGLDVAGSGLNSMAPDLAGILSLDGTGASDGTTVKIKGQLSAERLKLVKNGMPSKIPVTLDFADDHALRKNSGVIPRSAVHIGKSEATLAGGYAERGDSTDVKMDLEGKDMAATDLAQLLPVFGVTLPAGSSIQSGTLNAKLLAEGPADKLVTSGDIVLSAVRLANFDLGKKLAVVERLAGIQTSPDMNIQSASTNVRVGPDGITMQNIQFVVDGFGNLTGSGTISPTNTLDFKMTATVQGGQLVSTLGNVAVPFTVQGTSADPVFRPDTRAIANTEIKKVESKALGGLLNGLLGGKK
ncbi:MAG TPA: AsmA family protein [Terriglobia bacterium]|nr:AsmA family protein [Terriglobia bacterium]